METEQPTLRRPQKRLHYFLDKESSSTQWAGKVTLQDIDRLFDDLDSASDGVDELLPVSPLLKTSSKPEKAEMESEASPVPWKGHHNEKHQVCQMIPEGDVLQTPVKSVGEKLDMDMFSPFKGHGPMKTSSPIEWNKDVEEPDDEKDRTVSPILFACEDDVQEELKMIPLPIQKPPQSGQITEKSGDADLESPPNKFALSSAHTKKMESSRKESSKEIDPVTDKTVKKCPAPASEDPKTTTMQGSADPPVSGVRQEPQHSTHEKKSESVCRQLPVELCSRVGKDVSTFLQRVRDAGQTKPACPKRPLSQKVPAPPPEPEDDFCILEDDTPLLFSIPSKTAHSKSVSKQKKQSKTSSTDEEKSANKGTKDSQPEKVEKQQESVQTKSQEESQADHQKTKKKKGKGSDSDITSVSTAQMNPVGMKATEPADESSEDAFSSQEDFPAGDLMEEAKQNKKKHSRIPSKERKAADKADDQLRVGATSDSVKGKSTLKREKPLKVSEVRTSKPIKDGKENARKTKVKSSQQTREKPQANNSVQEPVSVEALMKRNHEQSDEEHQESVDLHSPQQEDEQHFSPAEEIMKPEVQREVASADPANGKAKQIKPLIDGEESSPENSQMLGKRKRRKPGEWWLSCPQIAEETKVNDVPPVLKKSKQKLRAEVFSPIKPRKAEDLGERIQSVLSPSQTTKQKAEKKKTKLNKKKTRTVETSTDQESNVAEELQDQEQQVLDQDSYDFPQREHTHAAGDKIFHRTYHRTPDAKGPRTPAPPPPRRSQIECVETPLLGKQRRKRISKRLEVNEISENVERLASQPQKLNPKNPKTQKLRGKQSKQLKSPALGIPKNGNVAVSPKPLGGAPEPLLKQRPLSAPKSVKRSLATFKDIFSSPTGNPTVTSSRGTCQRRRQEERPVQNSHVMGHPAEDPAQVSVSDSVRLDKTDSVVVTMDASEPKKKRDRPLNPEILRDSKCYTESMLKHLSSGPSSMIELEQYEENEDCTLPSSKDVHLLLSESEFCAPPLRPLVLQVKDKANLAEWLRNLWPVTVGNEGEVTPDHFNWYFYQGRAMGLHVDLHCGSFCNGKMLLGSYMKKPLWVDHSATTVFNILTSCVSVTINGQVSHFNPGQSFMVPHEHAYSIQNLTEEPAVLYFNRMLAGSLD
ncbi:treacle protein isoform X2 [Myripristis murdjan]|uniref:treacle protein isoform X2 n=1 Tax=Myripristis murdjan TaxID=586833 RepID=UPI0011761AA2|nr:treacle protein-like isoform X2 [Myripristis murdjan]